MGTAMPSEETDVSVSENEEQPGEEEEEEEPEEEEEEEEEETDDSMAMTPPVAQDPRNETAAAGGNGTNPVEDASSNQLCRFWLRSRCSSWQLQLRHRPLCPNLYRSNLWTRERPKSDFHVEGLRR